MWKTNCSTRRKKERKKVASFLFFFSPYTYNFLKLELTRRGKVCVMMMQQLFLLNFFSFFIKIRGNRSFAPAFLKKSFVILSLHFYKFKFFKRYQKFWRFFFSIWILFWRAFFKIRRPSSGRNKNVFLILFYFILKRALEKMENFWEGGFV